MLNLKLAELDFADLFEIIDEGGGVEGITIHCQKGDLVTDPSTAMILLLNYLTRWGVDNGDENASDLKKKLMEAVDASAKDQQKKWENLN